MKNKVKYLGNILVIVSFLFIIQYFREIYIDFSVICNYQIILIIVFGAVIVSCSVFILAYAWKNMLQYLVGEKINYKETAKVYAKANIGKYIPGNVMHFIERNIFLVKSGLGQLEMIISTVSEIAGQVIAAVLLGIIISAKNLWNIFLNVVSLRLIIIFAIILSVAICGFFILYKKNNKIRMILSKLFKLEFCGKFLFDILLYALSMLLLAIIMCCIVTVLKGEMLETEQILLVINIYAISWVAGFVIPGAPGGIGVREFVLIYLTRENELSDYILLAAVIHRIITVLGDVLAYLWSRWSDGRENRLYEKGENAKS